MRSVGVLVLVAVLHARLAHTRIVARISQKQGNPSDGEGSQSDPISSRPQLTKDDPEPVAAPRSFKMEFPADNGDQSYVLVPLRDLVRDKRDTEANSRDDQDSLYVMFPFHELARKPRVADVGQNGTLKEASNSSKEDRPEHRKRRDISTRAKWLLRNKKVAKQKPRTLSVRRERMSPELADDYDDSLHGEPAKHLRLDANRFPIDRLENKRKASSYMTEAKSQLHPETFDSLLSQKPRALSELSNLSPKFMHTIVGKPKKSSSNPINITMFISNLIPPNEVENTRITNAGKLYKSGCLKFSIQLERPCPCAPEDVCEDASGKMMCGLVVTQKPACSHLASVDDKSRIELGPVSQPTNCLQPVKCETPGNRVNDPSPKPDVSSLLLQLVGADKKAPTKPTPSLGQQALLMDNDVIKELQRLLSNQAYSKGPESTGKSSTAPAIINSQKARAIAEALNLFSKYSSSSQNNL